MKVTELISELEKLKTEFGDVDIIYSRNERDYNEVYCYLEKKKDLFVVTIKPQRKLTCFNRGMNLVNNFAKIFGSLK